MNTIFSCTLHPTLPTTTTCFRSFVDAKKCMASVSLYRTNAKTKTTIQDILFNKFTYNICPYFAVLLRCNLQRPAPLDMSAQYCCESMYGRCKRLNQQKTSQFRRLAACITLSFAYVVQSLWSSLHSNIVVCLGCRRHFELTAPWMNVVPNFNGTKVSLQTYRTQEIIHHSNRCDVC